jgi:CubicO group peptidase (beta-lactamase class C family)
MNRPNVSLHIFINVVILICASLPASAQTELSSELQRKIDTIATGILAETGVPSASMAIVKDGRIAYVNAFGDGRVEPRIPASPDMRFSVGSISKQFTATAILLLQEEGKLSLDDKVSKYVPDLTRANEVTIRQLLSHTSGYQDFWPQDYVMEPMLHEVTSSKIMDIWGHKPLDFDPGTQWQYSNTNYVIAGVIAEKVAGMPLFQFLQDRIFVPLGMKSVANIDEKKLGDADATGYLRYALGPLHPAPKEGKGWLFAMGELSMTAKDLARWDISIIDERLMKPSSYKELETEILLADGLGTNYGLGVGVSKIDVHRALSHGGEVSGFTAENIVFPDDSGAVVVLTNQDAADAANDIARSIAAMLFVSEDSTTTAKLDQARKVFDGLQHGTIDRSLFTDDANYYFNDEALKDFSSSLAPLGKPEAFVQVSHSLRGGMTLRIYRIRFPRKTLMAVTYETSDGKLEQYQIIEQE